MVARFLIVYGTTEGHTAKVAAAAAATLQHRGAAVSLQNSAAPWIYNPADYSAVIVAASVHAGTHQRSVRRWVQTHQVALNQRPGAFVSVCLAVLNKSPKVERDLGEGLQRFFDETGWKPTETKIVAGALPYTKYSWWKRWLMRRIVAKAHGDVDTSRDYVYTDWKDLDEFVSRFADRVCGEMGTAQRRAG
jgi:menaquinone-dependent protoporphyrinogen oxidase